jgi:hypothetical protein
VKKPMQGASERAAADGVPASRRIFDFVDFVQVVVLGRAADVGLQAGGRRTFLGMHSVS